MIGVLYEVFQESACFSSLHLLTSYVSLFVCLGFLPLIISGCGGLVALLLILYFFI